MVEHIIAGELSRCRALGASETAAAGRDTAAPAAADAAARTSFAATDHDSQVQRGTGCLTQTRC